MSYNTYDLLIYSLIICALSLIITTIKIRKRTLSLKKLGFFFGLVMLVAGVRFGLYFYLKVYLDNYYGSLDNLLSILLYPELPLSQEILRQTLTSVYNPEIPVYYYSVFWLTNVILFTLGSFVWLYPVLIFLSEEEVDSPNFE